MLMQKKSAHITAKMWTVNLVLAMTSTTWSVSALSKAERVETTIGDTKVRVTGRFMYDALLNSSLDSRDETQGDWRRARLGVRANFSDDWRFRISADFPDGDVDLRDLRIEYRGLPVRLAAGRMQEPFGMSENASSNYLVLMERPLATVLGPDYSTGVRANTRGKNWGLTAGVFGPDLAGVELTDNDSNNDDSVNVRGTFRAINTKNVLVHVGASASVRETNNNRGVRFNAIPESTLVSGLNISNPRIRDADSYNLGGAEFAVRNGPRLLQAEYITADIDRDSGQEATFYGYYVQGSWALTGEKRRYSTRNGVFGGIDPKRSLTALSPSFWQSGAWEVAARYSYLDLRDTDVDLDGDIDGEEGEVISVGVNWYPVANARVMLNAQHITEDSGRNTDNETVIQMRAQFFF